MSTFCLSVRCFCPSIKVKNASLYHISSKMLEDVIAAKFSQLVSRSPASLYKHIGKEDFEMEWQTIHKIARVAGHVCTLLPSDGHVSLILIFLHRLSRL